jgi:hypothetical protein
MEEKFLENKEMKEQTSKKINPVLRIILPAFYAICAVSSISLWYVGTGTTCPWYGNQNYDVYAIFLGLAAWTTTFATLGKHDYKSGVAMAVIRLILTSLAAIMYFYCILLGIWWSINPTF